MTMQSDKSTHVSENTSDAGQARCQREHVIIALLVIVLTLFANTAPAQAEDWQAQKVEIELPPASIAQWYKPANKRQVWLHTMFKLREQMAAVKLYGERGDLERLTKWAAELQETYASIATMVPEWKGELNLTAARALASSAASGDLDATKTNAKRMRRSCDACHRRFSASTTTLYRSPDYSEAKVVDSKAGEELSYRQAMKQMTHSLVALKIARNDGAFAVARAASDVLERQLHDLASSCGDCHREDAPRERILGPKAFSNLQALRSALTEPHDPKLTGGALGTLGFEVCGRCHGVHHTLSNLRRELAEPGSPAAEP